MVMAKLFVHMTMTPGRRSNGQKSVHSGHLTPPNLGFVQCKW